MSRYVDIRASLQARLDDVVGIPPAARRAYDNVPFTPPTDRSIWVRAQFLPFRRRPTDLTSTGLHRFDGTFVISVYAEADKGPPAAETLADEIVKAYDAGTILPAASTDAPTVQLEFAEVDDSGFYDPPWYIVPVSVKWKAFSQ